jgi:DNA phosphorothioation-dependent restriction protein DptH
MHVAIDAFMYSDLSLLYPYQVNPLLGLLSPSTVSNVGLVSYPLAIIVYLLRITLMGWISRRADVETEQKASEPEGEELEEPSDEEEQSEPPVIHKSVREKPLEPAPESPAPVVVEAEPAVEPPLVESEVTPDIYLGTERVPRQWGIVGRTGEELVALDLNEPHIVFVCGKQGSGKGYTIGVVSEMLLSKTVPGISQVRKPATLIVFHKPREDMRSEFWSIVEENTDTAEVKTLREQYGVNPRRIITERSFRIFVDPYVYLNEREKFEEEYGTKVYPIGIKPNRLTAEDWPHVLSLGKKSGSMYVKKVFQIIKKTQYEEGFGLRAIRREVEASDLNPNQKGFAMMRLETLEDYLEGGDFIGDLILGGVNVFDLRKIMMEPDDIFSVMMLVISALINNERTEREQFVFVINEAHDYLRKGLSKDFTDYINYLIRKKRHAGTWLMLDTHFPEDVDPKVIKGSDIKIFHKSDVVSSNLLRQVVEGTPTPPHLLNTGEAIIRADKSNLGPDRVLIINVRPRLTHHGAATRTAI